MGNLIKNVRVTTFIQGLFNREPELPLDAALKARIARSLVDRITRNPKEGRAAISELLERIASLQEENKMLRISALTDPLTGAHNQRYFHQAMDEIRTTNEDSERRQSGHHFIVMVDLDGFKNINDTYGHAVGDIALCHVVQSLKKITRKTDAVCRIGGDEFVVILKNATVEGAHSKIIQISDLFDDMKFSYEGIDVPVRASIGWTEIEPESFIKDIMKKIDDYVYEAKKIKGKSRFSSLTLPGEPLSSPDMMTTESGQTV